jgi:salicylate hydroxylase
MAQPLRILVAGAGIGGVAAALACSRAGHDVQVFEKAAAFAPFGAGIQLGPNVTRVLHQWGLASALKQVAASPTRLLVRSAQTGAVLGQLRLGDNMEKRYGAPYVTLHRADLQGLLAQALEKAAGPAIAFGHAVGGFTQDAASVRLRLQTTDGHTPLRDGDLVVGADGLWSKVRQALHGDGEPKATGHMALRSLIRQSDLPAPLRAALNSDDIGVWLGPNLHVVHYPVKGGEWLNLVVIAQNTARALPDAWSQTVGAADLDPILNGLFSSLRDLLSLPGQPDDNRPQWRKWDLFIRPPMQAAREHGFGRVALLGDAAHPMLPFLAQGAGMAIEDAQALADTLTHATDVSTQLEKFGQVRWQRNARVQSRSHRNAQIFHARGVTRLGRDVAMKLLGERLLDVPWLYGER